MNSFDSTILHFLNQFSQHSWFFDKTLQFVAASSLLKGGVVSTILVWLWFQDDELKSDARKHIIATIVCCPFAMLLARGLALTLPFRLRPIHEEVLNFVLPYGSDIESLESWSAFPSDHAVLFYTLSIGLLFASRKFGIFALIYTTVFIALPRIYLGLHYPTDILSGAFLGLVIGWIGNQRLMINKISIPILLLSQSKPSLFYAISFLILFQISEMFKSSRVLIHAGMSFLRQML